jgi:GDA1/CD39 (nucleoside phosphatase) family
LPSNAEFLALSGYYYTHSCFKLGHSLSLEKLQMEGSEYCDTEWGKLELVAKYSDSEDKYLKQYCFKVAYIVTLIHEVYGFPMDTRKISTTDSLQGNEISWTLGAMIHMAGAKLDEGRNPEASPMRSPTYLPGPKLKDLWRLYSISVQLLTSPLDFAVWLRLT